MLLKEFASSVQSQQSMHDEFDDQSVKSIDDVRTSKLTLENINKIRRSKDIKRYEIADKQRKVQAQYSQSADTDSI